MIVSFQNNILLRFILPHKINALVSQQKSMATDRQAYQQVLGEARQKFQMLFAMQTGIWQAASRAI